MKITTNIGSGRDDTLETFRPKRTRLEWERVNSGYWSEGPFHSGHISYHVARTKKGVWLLDGVERNECLDDVTPEDVKMGCLNDDQLQALWGKTLRQAQREEYRRIVAVLEGAPPEMTWQEAARLMCEQVGKDHGKTITEPDENLAPEE